MDCTTLTNPTGAAMISSGFEFPLIDQFIETHECGRRVSDGKDQSSVLLSVLIQAAALSIHAAARVVPFFLAACATSSSDIKQ